MIDSHLPVVSGSSVHGRRIRDESLARTSKDFRDAALVVHYPLFVGYVIGGGPPS
jgi:hypothetical protein